MLMMCVCTCAADGVIRSTDEGMLACQAHCTTNYAACEKVAE